MKKVEAKMRFCLQEKTRFQTSRPPGVVPGKNRKIRDACGYVRGAGGLGGRDGGGVFTITAIVTPYATLVRTE